MSKLACLPIAYAKLIRQQIDVGTLGVDELASLSTSDRRSKLAELFTEAEKASRKARKEVGAEQIKTSRQEIDDLVTRFNKGFEERIVSSSRNLNQKVNELEFTIKNLEEATDLTSVEKAKLTRARAELADLEGTKEVLMRKQSKLLNSYVERELAKAAPKTRKRTLDKINELNYLLEPGERQVFLEELITSRFGFSVTEDTRKTLLALSKESADAITAGRKYYEGEDFARLRDYYKNSHPTLKK